MKLFYLIYPKPEIPAEAEGRGLNAEEKKMLNEYEAPPLDQGIDDGLNDFMAKRKEALAGTGDF